jgi:HEAT repeat protein
MLQEAQHAATQQHWSQVVQVLRHCSPRLPSAPSTEQAQALNLALDILLWGDFQARWEVAKVMPHLGEPARDVLIELLQDETIAPEVRWFAARILGEFQDPATIAPLMHCLQPTAEPEIAQAAALALANLGDLAIAPLTTALNEPQTCPLAIQALAQIRHPAIVSPLLRVLDHPEAAIRAQVVEALSCFRTPGLVEVLVAVLRDVTAQVRKAAVVGLGLWVHRPQLFQAAGRDPLTLLTPYLDDFSLDVCQQAAIALGRLGTPEAAAALFHVLQRETTPVPLQCHLIRALGYLESAQTLDYWQTLLPSCPVVAQREIIRALGHWQKPDFKFAASQLLITFWQMTGQAAMPIALQKELCQTWGQLGDAIALPTLQQLAKSPHQTIQLHANAAIAAINHPPSTQS